MPVCTKCGIDKPDKEFHKNNNRPVSGYGKWCIDCIKLNRVINEHKKCVTCETIQPKENFNERWDSKDGRSNKCKNCKHKYNSKYRVDNIEELKEIAKENYVENREEISRKNSEKWLNNEEFRLNKLKYNKDYNTSHKEDTRKRRNNETNKA